MSVVFSLYTYVGVDGTHLSFCLYLYSWFFSAHIHTSCLTIGVVVVVRVTGVGGVCLYMCVFIALITII